VLSIKGDDNTENDFIIPEMINQVFGNAVIYNQAGSMVYYEARFSREMCGVTVGSKTLPAGSSEMKLLWSVIQEADKHGYIWINADINRDGVVEVNELLGLVGALCQKYCAAPWVYLGSI
jgi:hypothetical protein